MDGCVLAVLAAYQNNLVSSENDDVTSGEMFPTSNDPKIRLLSRERVKIKARVNEDVIVEKASEDLSTVSSPVLEMLQSQLEIQCLLLE